MGGNERKNDGRSERRRWGAAAGGGGTVAGAGTDGGMHEKVQAFIFYSRATHLKRVRTATKAQSTLCLLQNNTLRIARPGKLTLAKTRRKQQTTRMRSKSKHKEAENIFRRILARPWHWLEGPWVYSCDNSHRSCGLPKVHCTSQPISSSACWQASALSCDTNTCSMLHIRLP